MDALLKFVQTANSYLADYILVILLIGTGLFFTIKTRFVQIRCFGEGIKRTFGNIRLSGGKQRGGLSSFQALVTAVAAQVGTGNIVGASGAILIGGPGAVFWMWVIAFFGMATVYAEAVLAQQTREVDSSGNVRGGPVYYIRKAFRGGFGKFLSVFFAVAAILALGFMGAMVQSNSIAESGELAFGIDGWVIGLVLALFSAFVFLGGVSRLASVTEKLVPLMAVLYIFLGIVVLGARIRYIPETVAMIFKYAFAPQALIGGSVGFALKTALSQGAKRGLFSNEAGMGSTPHAHAQANVKKPHDQGVVAMIGVFTDTFVILTMTALVIISSLYAGNGPLAGVAARDYAGTVAAQGIANTNALQTAIAVTFGSKTLGNIFVAVCLLFFAFSTIISWNFFGRINIQYLTRGSKSATVVYSILAIGFVFLGSVLSNSLVWELTDFFNYMMVLPNVLALAVLAKTVKKAALPDKE